MSALYQYRGQGGQWAWLLHRITGIGVFLFLLIHVLDIYLAGFGPTTFDAFIFVYRGAIFRVGEVLLMGAVLYHSFNGIRVILIDFWTKGVEYQKVMFYIVLILSVIVWIPAGFFMLRPLFIAAF